MKKREAEEHEEKEFLQHASPDQQAQQAELDKGIFYQWLNLIPMLLSTNDNLE